MIRSACCKSFFIPVIINSRISPTYFLKYILYFSILYRCYHCPAAFPDSCIFRNVFTGYPAENPVSFLRSHGSRTYPMPFSSCPSEALSSVAVRCSLCSPYARSHEYSPLSFSMVIRSSASISASLSHMICALVS